MKNVVYYKVANSLFAGFKIETDPYENVVTDTYSTLAAYTFVIQHEIKKTTVILFKQGFSSKSNSRK